MSRQKESTNRIPETLSDKIFNIIILAILILALIVVIYPLYFVVLGAVSDPGVVNSGGFLWYPKGFQLDGLKMVFQDNRIWNGYANTIFYTVGGTIVGVLMVIMAGYALSRDDMPGRNIIMAYFVLTMYFGGGLIPTFLVVKQLGLVDTRAIIIIMGSFSVYNMIIVRSFFANSLPKELQEAAFIDGCSNQRFFFSIVVPVSKPIIAVIALYCAVGQWNSFFNAMIYLNTSEKYPLQLILREILLTFSALAGQNSEQMIGDPSQLDKMRKLSEIMKYGAIIVSTVPILCVYPFIQKYFVKGVMIGSIKG